MALAGISFADILIFMQLGFRGALYDSNTAFIKSINAPIILASPEARNSQNFATFSRRRLYQAQDIPGVTEAYPLYSNILSWKNPQTGAEAFIQLVGFDPAHPAFDIPELNRQLPKLKIPRKVLFDRRSRGDYDQVVAQLETSQTLITEADGKTLELSGLFSLGASFGSDGFVMTSRDTFALTFPRRRPETVSLGLVYLDPNADPTQVARQLRQHLPMDVEVFTKAEFVAKEIDYWSRQSPIGFVFGLGTVMAFVVGVVIVYQVLSTDVNAHIQEYATFKAIGYRQRYLLLIVFEEALVLAVLGFFPGLLVSLGMYRLAAKATSLPLVLRFNRAISVLLITLVMCLISGAIATRKLQEADPADMF